MSPSKIPHVSLCLEKRANTSFRKERFSLYERASSITPIFIGRTVHIHNGLLFVPISITEQHIGFKFGDFSLTRKRVIHKKKKNNLD